MHSPAPTIVQLAERILREVELAVRGWTRYHKYAQGTELRQQAKLVAQLAHRAWREPDLRVQWVTELARSVDDLKLALQIDQQIQCFRSFKQFEAIARTTADLGRQVGGWRKQQHRKGQNADAPPCAPQRAQILSPRAASQSEALR